MKLSRKLGFTRLLISNGASMAHRKTIIRGSAFVPAVALLAALVTSPVTADAASATADDRDCTIQSYPHGGDLGFDTWKGKDDPSKENGETKHQGRTLRLLTSRSLDRSAGQIDNSRLGDRVWVDITGDGGHNWQQCGIKTGQQGKTTTPWFQHGTVKNRWIRACMEVDGFTKCAHVGDKDGPNDGRKWWSDE